MDRYGVIRTDDFVWETKAATRLAKQYFVDKVGANVVRFCYHKTTLK